MSIFMLFRPFMLACILLLSLNSSSAAQRRQGSIAGRRADDSRRSSDQPGRGSDGISVADYLFGPGDVVSLAVADAPEMSGNYQIGENGDIAVPLLGQVKVWGLTGAQLATSISDKLKASELLVDPIVNIAIMEYHSRTVLVLGAVTRPAAYPLERPTTLLDVISLAGGLTSNAGNTVSISHKQPTSGEPQPIVVVDLTKLVRGTDPLGNIQVHDGDVVNVSLASVVYVVGAVNRPGGFVIEDPSSGITILQAVALAEGLQSIAAPNRGLLLRKAIDGKPREEIPIDIGNLLKRKGADRTLEPNDIVFIPESGSKKTLHAMGRMAEAGVTGVTTYGLGLRVAGTR